MGGPFSRLVHSTIWWQAHRPLRTLGSLALSRALLQAGLVDRYRVALSWPDATDEPSV